MRSSSNVKLASFYGLFSWKCEDSRSTEQDKSFSENWDSLTEVAGEGGTDCPPQKFLSSQKFRHLMGWRNMQKKIFLSCLVSEIQLFVYIFGWISKWPPEVRKGWLVKFFEVSYYQKNFQPPTLPNSEDRGGMKMPYDFFVYICDF